ncbi:unnamed protein product [Blepharisma stoltei]|uniref:non-specific serine/threonine protein kinase n=1 Tax=Blepharisma stoltei TaxID=1481888 RepID=A0AAU9JM72_9CILI|nr:unnamed protein product [Blepharisma stoltei]
MIQSIFENEDSQACDKNKFWMNCDSIPSSPLYEGILIERTKKGLVSNLYILSGSALFKANPETFIVTKVTILKWKIIQILVDGSEKDKNYGFRIGHLGLYRDFYAQNQDDLNNWIAQLSSIGIMTEIENDYCILEEIGKGSFSTVQLAVEKVTSKKFAIKCTRKSDLGKRKYGFEYMRNEIDIMRKLDHPNILKLIKVYEDQNSVFLVFDYIEGGDLRRKISLKKKFEECEAKRLIQKLLRVIEYHESLNITHRDIKLENILIVDREEDIDFKLADFGLAIEACGEIKGSCGSLGYAAPEVLRGKIYNSKIDVFSAGIILYMLLSGRAPFPGKTTNEVFLKNRECNIKFKGKRWSEISSEAINFIRKITSYDPDLRPSAKTALQDEWFESGKDQNENEKYDKDFSDRLNRLQINQCFTENAKENSGNILMKINQEYSPAKQLIILYIVNFTAVKERFKE